MRIVGYPEPIFLRGTEKILTQMKTNIGNIKINGKWGTGFFCEIPNKEKSIQVFITNDHVIDQNYINSNKNDPKLKINRLDGLSNKQKIINFNNRVIYHSPVYDITIIEINKNEDKVYDYLELDENILNENNLDDYIGKSIYIMQYPVYRETVKLAVSYGTLGEICNTEGKKYEFTHYCCTEFGSSGSPILTYNNKVIGIHKHRDLVNRCNVGSFLNYAIKEFIEKYNKEKNNSITGIENLKKTISNNESTIISYNNFIKNTYINQNYNINIINNNRYINDDDKKYLIEFDKKFNLKITDINITSLNLRSKNIGNEGLNYLCEKMNFKELKELNLSDNYITDIEALKKAKFEKLEILDLFDNKIKNIDALKNVNFKELKKLYLHYNKITDIKVFKEVQFEKLELLQLAGNEISDINILKTANFKELKEINLCGNEISDINVLENVQFEKLEKLNLSYNKISNIDILESANFKDLKELNLSENNITNIEVFEKVQFENLETLKLNKNKASNIEVLENIEFKKIKELDLSQNNISIRNRRLLEKVKNKLNLNLNIWPKNDHLVFKNKE